MLGITSTSRNLHVDKILIRPVMWGGVGKPLSVKLRWVVGHLFDLLHSASCGDDLHLAWYSPGTATSQEPEYLLQAVFMMVCCLLFILALPLRPPNHLNIALLVLKQSPFSFYTKACRLLPIMSAPLSSLKLMSRL